MTTKSSKVFVLAASAISLFGAMPAFADDEKPHHDACPFTDRLRHWTDVDKQTAIIEMGVNQRYKVTFIDDCSDMKFAIFAKVESRPGLCLSPGDRITFGPRHGIPTTCVISTIEQLPPPGATPASAPAPSGSN